MAEYATQIITGLCTTVLVGLALGLWRIHVRSAAIPRIEKVLGEVLTLTKELHDWHDQRDADGVPVWYVRKSLETTIGDLTKAVSELSKASNNHVMITQGVAKVLDRISDKLSK